ncbi:hypothetical protein [Flavobacterium sp.]|uniref:hypothetical protein n=1 Tax=Flavobacterium sp. TaxID=239 RepID=UPI0031DB55DD
MKEEKVPFKTMIFAGVTFKVINRHEAHTIIGDLTNFNNQKIYNVFEDTWRFPDYEENPIFLLAEDDVEMDSFEMDFSTDEHPDVFILGFIFKGNLNVAKLISSYDTDNSPALIVFGKTTAVNITLFGSIHYLGGGVQCDVLMGEYNHGELFVKGDVKAWLIHSDDMLMHFERFTDVEAIINVGRPDIMICSNVEGPDGLLTIENYFPSTHKLSDIVDDAFIDYSSYEDGILGNNYLEVFKEGLSILNYDKKDQYTYADFRNQFINMVNALSETEELKEEGKIIRNIGTTIYSFIPFDYEGMKYSQISEEISNGFDIRMRALWCHDTEEITLVLEYLYEDGNPKYQWANNETAPGIEMLCVKRAALKTFEILTAEVVEEEEDDEDEREYTEYDSSFSLEEFTPQFGSYKLPDDLVKLYQFQQEYGSETYSECFGLLVTNDKTGIKTWSEEEEFYNSFIEFAGANGSGSSYAYWLIDDDLNYCPIVVFGDEGGIHVVAENIRKLIHLLTLDTEISVDFDYAYFYKDDEYYSENENKEVFHEWVKKEFNLDPIETNEEADVIVDEAKEKYKKKLNDFLTKFGIEIGEEDDE